MNIKHAQYMLTVLKEGSITAACKKALYFPAILKSDDQAGGKTLLEHLFLTAQQIPLP